jgi:hypothetical protein
MLWFPSCHNRQGKKKKKSLEVQQTVAQQYWNNEPQGLISVFSLRVYLSLMDSASRQLGARKKPGSSATSPKRDVVLFALTVLAIIACCAIFVFSHRDRDETNAKIHDAALGEDYEALLRRAKALTSKYQELTGRTDLPHDLTPNTAITQSTENTNPSIGQQQNSPPMPPKSSAGSSAGASSSADLVIGMAQDTDPKNFVSR